jgi:hypothetical protein
MLACTCWQTYSAKERIGLLLGDQTISDDDTKKKGDGKKRKGLNDDYRGTCPCSCGVLGHNWLSLHIHVCQRGSKRSNHATSEGEGPLGPFLR